MLASVRLDRDCCSVPFGVRQPLPNNSCVEPLEFCQDTFWHSSAHVLGYAIEQVFPDAQLTHGPATDQGFFYDFSNGSQVVKEDDYHLLEQKIKKICKARFPFERLELSKEQALDMFAENKYKCQFIEEKVESLTSVYRIGDFVDLCMGPHIEHTGHVKAMKILKHSGSYWQGDASKDALQRIYAISFAEKSHMKEYLAQQEEALKRDHRVLGQK